MKLTSKNVIKGDKSYYVVTRHGRRIEDTNYHTQAQARERATALYEMLKEWDPENARCVNIVHTSKPRKIY